MVTQLTDRHYELAPGAVFSIEGAGGYTIRSQSAALWLTESGQTRDIVLRTGEQFSSAGQGRLVIEALGGVARFSVSRPASPLERVRSRLGHALHRLGDLIEGCPTSGPA